MAVGENIGFAFVRKKIKKLSKFGVLHHAANGHRKRSKCYERPKWGHFSILSSKIVALTFPWS